MNRIGMVLQQYWDDYLGEVRGVFVCPIGMIVIHVWPFESLESTHSSTVEGIDDSMQLRNLCEKDIHHHDNLGMENFVRYYLSLESEDSELENTLAVPTN